MTQYLQSGSTSEWATRQLINKTWLQRCINRYRNIFMPDTDSPSFAFMVFSRTSNLRNQESYRRNHQKWSESHAKIGRGSADDIRTILASGRNKTFLQGLSSWTIDNCGKGVFESLQQLLTRMLGITEFLLTQCASSTQLKENAETKTKDFGKYIFSCLIIVDPKHIGILL